MHRTYVRQVKYLSKLTRRTVEWTLPDRAASDLPVDLLFPILCLHSITAHPKIDRQIVSTEESKGEAVTLPPPHDRQATQAGSPLRQPRQQNFLIASHGVLPRFLYTPLLLIPGNASLARVRTCWGPSPSWTSGKASITWFAAILGPDLR